MSEEQLRTKLQNENNLLQIELTVLIGQRDIVNDIERLRRENKELRERVGAVRMDLVRRGGS